MPEKTQTWQSTRKTRGGQIAWNLAARVFRTVVEIVQVLVIVVPMVAVLDWLYSQDWSGFGQSSSPISRDNRAKTLWDWMELLIVPAVLSAGALLFNSRIRQTEIEIAEKRQKYEEQIASDRLQETILQNYLDQVAELLLKENLRTSSSDDEVRTIARVRTITTLQRLDGKRNGILTNFLLESHLLVPLGDSTILQPNDLSRVNLSEADFSEADLSGIGLIEANLHKCKLAHTNLTGAFLYKANLSEAFLYHSREHSVIQPIVEMASTRLREPASSGR